MGSRMASAARWAALSLAVTFTACSEKEPAPGPGGNNPDPQTPTAGTISGRALDTQGRPLANVKVTVEPALTKGDALSTRTGADGTYRFEGLPSVPYWTRAWKEVDFNGQRFCLRLAMPEPAQYEAVNPSSGAVRNFRWQLTGAIPDFAADPEYFGGRVSLPRAGDFSGSTLQLTFTPTSPLIDGTPASTVTRTLQLATQEPVIQDLPVANYTVTGTITKDGTQRPLHIGLEAADSYEEQTASAALTFQPGGNPCVSLASGVRDANLFLHSPF
jgi:hypothetical protein